MHTPPGSANTSSRAATFTPSPKTLGDDVAEIDPNAEPDPPVFGHIGFMVEHCALGFYRAAYSIQYAPKFHQHAVAGGLDDAPMVLGDLRIDELVAQRVETFEGDFFVRSHQPRVAGDIGGEDRCKPADGGHNSGSRLLSVRPGHAEHVLADVGEDQIGRDRRGLVE